MTGYSQGLPDRLDQMGLLVRREPREETVLLVLLVPLVMLDQ